MKFSGVTILHRVEISIFLFIFEWPLQQCSVTALAVVTSPVVSEGYACNCSYDYVLVLIEYRLLESQFCTLQMFPSVAQVLHLHIEVLHTDTRNDYSRVMPCVVWLVISRSRLCAGTCA